MNTATETTMNNENASLLPEPAVRTLETADLTTDTVFTSSQSATG